MPEIQFDKRGIVVDLLFDCFPLHNVIVTPSQPRAQKAKIRPSWSEARKQEIKEKQEAKTLTLSTKQHLIG